jgi:hypothetical protein
MVAFSTRTAWQSHLTILSVRYSSAGRALNLFISNILLQQQRLCPSTSLFQADRADTSLTMKTSTITSAAVIGLSSIANVVLAAPANVTEVAACNPNEPGW